MPATPARASTRPAMRARIGTVPMTRPSPRGAGSREACGGRPGVARERAVGWSRRAEARTAPERPRSSWVRLRAVPARASRVDTVPLSHGWSRTGLDLRRAGDVRVTVATTGHYVRVNGALPGAPAAAG